MNPWVVPPQPPERPKSKAWLIILLALGVPGMCLISAVAFGLYVTGAAETLPVTDADRARLLTAEELAERFAAPRPNGEQVTIRKHKNRLDEEQLIYVFDPGDDGGLALETTLIRLPEDAVLADAFEDRAGDGFAELLIDVSDARDHDALYRCCEQSKLQLFYENGSAKGFAFTAREGRNLYLARAWGVPLGAEPDLEALLGAKVSRLAEWKP